MINMEARSVIGAIIGLKLFYSIVAATSCDEYKFLFDESNGCTMNGSPICSKWLDGSDECGIATRKLIAHFKTNEMTCEDHDEEIRTLISGCEFGEHSNPIIERNACASSSFLTDQNNNCIDGHMPLCNRWLNTGDECGQRVKSIVESDISQEITNCKNDRVIRRLFEKCRAVKSCYEIEFFDDHGNGCVDTNGAICSKLLDINHICGQNALALLNKSNDDEDCGALVPSFTSIMNECRSTQMKVVDNNLRNAQKIAKMRVDREEDYHTNSDKSDKKNIEGLLASPPKISTFDKQHNKPNLRSGR